MKKVTVLYVCLFFNYCFGQTINTSTIDSLLQLYRNLNWNGVVFAGTSDSLMYKRAFGFANVEHQLLMDTSTLFKTESVGKMFTAVRIMQLMQQQKLNAGSTVKELLPDWQIPNADRIQVQHLLAHRSGLTSPWDHPDYSFDKSYSYTDSKRMIETAPLRFTDPGTAFAYSNSAYVLLAEIISRIDGITFEESIRKHIFIPAGMTHTFVLRDSILPHNAARPYYQITASQFIKDETKYAEGKASGAGGWMSTAGDLFRFAQAYLNHVYLPQEWMHKQLTNDGTIADTSVQWRFGLMPLSTRLKEEVIVGHNGGGRGFSVDVFFDVNRKHIVVFCSNQWGTGYGLTGRVFASISKRSFKAPIHSNEIRLCSYLIQEGTALFLLQPDSVLKSLDVPATERVMLNVFDNLALLHKYDEAADVITVVRKFFPQRAWVWMRSADNAVTRKRIKEAALFYESALQLAIENKEQGLIEMIRKKQKDIIDAVAG